MNQCGRIITDIKQLCELFATNSDKPDSLLHLAQAATDRGQWRYGHDHFKQARARGDAARKRGSVIAAAQYDFEEICWKTLFNLTGEPAPFDADSPYWVIPLALHFARHLGVGDTCVLAVVAPCDIHETNG